MPGGNPAGPIFDNLLSYDNGDRGITAIGVSQDVHAIYAASTNVDGNQNVRTHLYKGAFDYVTGNINDCWQDVTGNLPNKAIQCFSTNGSTCGNEFVFACVRGMGPWRNDITPLNITINKIDVSCYEATDGTLTANTSNGLQPFTYTWNNSQTTPTITGLAVGTYTVTVADANGCTATASATVAVDPNTLCCENLAGNYISDQGDFDFLGTTFPNADYSLNESVIFNNSSANYTIMDCNFSIKEGVSITIPAGVTVEINHCTFESCKNMWQGFIIEDGGILIIDGLQSTTLRDAQYAIQMLDGSAVTLNNCNLDHNYVDVKMEDNANVGFITTGTTYSCTGCLNGNPLKPGYAGQTPLPLNNTFAGILANNSIFNIGDVSKNTNHFIGLYRGISIKNCVNTIVNTDFTDITHQSQYVELPTDKPGGIAIHSEMGGSGILRQVGLGMGSAANPTFLNCFMCIDAYNGYTSITQNNVINSNYCFSVQDVKFNDVSIKYNRMQTIARYGIRAANNESANSIAINDNIINVEGNMHRHYTCRTWHRAHYTYIRCKIQYNNMHRCPIRYSK
ncbi:MAG: hypothetical protein IPP29_11030 [Bacteroidetes bacterium]|nr:hypothetical protein [Bacteroidota bacterium]